MDDLGRACRSMCPAPAQVLRSEAEFPGTVTLRLEAPGIDPQPGQFLMVGRPGYGEIPISVSNVTPEGLELTVQEVGPGSRAVAQTEPGGWLGVRGPYGTEWPLGAGAAGDLLIVAGGLGLAPLKMAFLEAVQRANRRVLLVYGTREPARIVFPRALERWTQEGAAEVHVTVDMADPGWTGHVGLVTALIDRLDLTPAQTTAFLCGPELMMRFCARDLVALGVPREAIHVSLERHMSCGTAVCGRCQLGPFVLCRDGAVVPYARVERALSIAEL